MSGHLRLVDTIPPELEEGDGDGDEALLFIDISISSDDGMTQCRKAFPADLGPDNVATALLMTMRGTLAAYDLDVQLAFEKALLTWKGEKP